MDSVDSADDNANGACSENIEGTASNFDPFSAAAKEIKTDFYRR